MNRSQWGIFSKKTTKRNRIHCRIRKWTFFLSQFFALLTFDFEIKQIMKKKSNVNKCLFCVNKEPLFGIYTIYIVKSNVCTVVRSVHTKNIIQTYNQAMYFVNIRYISPQTAQNLLYVFLQLFYCFSKKKRKKLSDG